MSYADNTDVTPLLPSGFSGVSTDTLDDWCIFYSSAIDAVLKRVGFATIPATHADDISALSGYVARIAAADGWSVAYVADEQPGHVRAWREMWQRFLKGLEDGSFLLPSQILPDGAVVRVTDAYRKDAYRTHRTQYDRDDYTLD